MKVKRLYTIGDSWTYGDELDNSAEESWPSVLSKDIGCGLVNMGSNGGSNDWMFRRTVEWVSKRKSFDNIVVIVAWSEPNRREIRENHFLIGDDIPKEFLNDRLSHKESICYMITLQEFLKSKNIKYLFFYPWYDLIGWSEHNKKVIEQIDKKYCIGPYVRGYKKGYPVDEIMLQSEHEHPDIKQHKTMAKFIKEKLIELYG